MPHPYIQAWPLVRGKGYQRYAITQTRMADESSPVDATAPVRENVRYGFNLGWSTLTAAEAADVQAAAELTGMGTWALPFAEWDSAQQRYVLTEAWDGLTIHRPALPFSGSLLGRPLAARRRRGPGGGLQVLITISVNGAEPFDLIVDFPFVGDDWYVSGPEWPALDALQLSGALLADAGAVAGDRIELASPWLERRVRMCAIVGQEFVLTATPKTTDRWQAQITIEEDEGASRALGWLG